MHIHPMPQVAVLLATYNGAAYVLEFLDSLRAQTFKNFTVYVRDDGSTDATVKLLQSYDRFLAFHLIPSVKRLGPAQGFLSILEFAGSQFDFYFFADQDDYWYPDKIERAIAALTPHRQQVALYCSRLEYVDENLEHLKYSPIPRVISLENAVVQNVATGCTVAITSRTRTQVLAADPFGFIMHDWWLYLYSAAFGVVIYDPLPSIKYRQHGGNSIGAAIGVVDDMRRRLIRFKRREGGVHHLSSQINAFLTCYGKELNGQQLDLLTAIVEGKRSLVARVRMALRPSFVRQSAFDTFVLRLLFLFGRY